LKYYDDNNNEIDGLPINAGDYIVEAVVVDPNYTECNGCTFTETFTINKADLTVKADDLINEDALTYCDPAVDDPCDILNPVVTFTFTGFVVDENGNPIDDAASVFPQGISYVIEDNDGEVNSGNAYAGNAGTYYIKPIAQAANYDIVAQNGIMTVNRAEAYFQFVEDESFDYDGIEKNATVKSIPEDRIITYTILYNGISQLPINAGPYTVEVLVDDPNYTYSGTGSGLLTINKVPLTLEAHDVFIDFGEDPANSYTYSLYGFVGSEDEFSVFGDVGADVQFAVESYSEPGSYTITPSLVDPTNYYIDQPTITGTLYVNWVDDKAKKIRTYLDCVQESGDPEFPFTAYFFYENTNSYPIYEEPGGPYNYIVSEGVYDGTLPPAEFVPGGGSFTVNFDGQKLTWTVFSGSNHNTSVSSDASSSSGRCSFDNARIGDVNTETSNSESLEDKLNVGNSSIMIYPNPVRDKFILTIIGDKETVGDIMMFDALGRFHDVRSSWNSAANGFEVDVAHLNHGLYLLKINIDAEDKIFRIIKE
jgi:hypothetical protein